MQRDHGDDHVAPVPASAWEPRPMAPADLLRLLRGEISEVDLQGLLATLRADPAWRVLEPFAYPSGCLVQMAYQPTGQPLGFYAERLGPTRWRFVP